MTAPRFITDKFTNSVAQIGRAAMNSLYPSDFEAYLVAMELVDSLGVTEEYFIFPVMPSQIQKTENNRTTVKKSSSGTTVLFSASSTPDDLSIKGNFGRSFKLLVKPNVSGEKFGFGFNFGQLSAKTPEFDATVKTGYGATKILQRICKKSNQLDWLGNPRRLFFYNLAFGESYLCVVPNGGLNFSQTYETNMIWNYSLNLTLIANLEDLKSSVKPSSSTDLMKASAMQAGITGLTRDISTFAKGGVNQILAKL